MIAKEVITEHLDNCLEDTSFLDLPGLRKGKVRDSYQRDDRLILITTDRQSAFDRQLALVPFKGQVLNQVSEFWFNTTRDIVQNHVIAVPDPNVTVAKKVPVLPIEFVVRGYLTGSTDTAAWTLYANGERTICGNTLPDGMSKNQQFDSPIITPTTKAETHDESISAEEIVARGILDEDTWHTASRIALSLFARGTEIAAQHGLILVDTKYEFGRDDEGNLVLVDEIHTPDSSRYWLADTYQRRIAEGKEPDNIDKEFLRIWFREHCDPYNDETLPAAPAELITELSSRYIQLYEMITGRSFEPHSDEAIPQRIARNIAAYVS